MIENVKCPQCHSSVKDTRLGLMSENEGGMCIVPCANPWHDGAEAPPLPPQQETFHTKCPAHEVLDCAKCFPSRVEPLNARIDGQDLPQSSNRAISPMTRGRNEMENGAATMGMPRYKCHKEVFALKIAEVRQAPADQERTHAGGDWYLVPVDTGYGPILVGHDEFYVKHKPVAGGYYVVYPPDGYKSFSPAQAFEEGYTRV